MHSRRRALSMDITCCMPHAPISCAAWGRWRKQRRATPGRLNWLLTIANGGSSSGACAKFKRQTGDSAAESFPGTSSRSYCHFFSILRRRARFKRAEKPSGYVRNFVDRRKERLFVWLRRFVKACDFSHKLERSGSDLFGRDRWLEVEEDFDIPA